MKKLICSTRRSLSKPREEHSKNIIPQWRWGHTANIQTKCRWRNGLVTRGRWAWSHRPRPKSKWAVHSWTSTSSQKFWRVKFRNVKISSIWVTALKESFRKIKKMSKWSFQLQGTVDTDVEIDRKISSAKVSEKAPFRAKSCKEICNAPQPTKNEIAELGGFHPSRLPRSG